MKKDLINASSTNTLSYSGDVAIKLFDGDRLLASGNSHNEGMPQLFRFLSNCLAGNFTDAKSLRPCKIILFKNADGESSSAPFNPNYWTEDTRVSSPIFQDSAVPQTEEDGKCVVTYHFRVPYTSLYGGEVITKVGLYPNLIGQNFTNTLCAYNFLASPITIPPGGGNFTVIIDWTITIINTTITDN